MGGIRRNAEPLRGTRTGSALFLIRARRAAAMVRL